MFYFLKPLCTKKRTKAEKKKIFDRFLKKRIKILKLKYKFFSKKNFTFLKREKFDAAEWQKKSREIILNNWLKNKTAGTGDINIGNFSMDTIVSFFLKKFLIKT